MRDVHTDMSLPAVDVNVHCTTMTPLIQRQQVSLQLITVHHTLTLSVLTAIFPGEPRLAGCLLNSPSPFIPGLCILLGQT